MRPIRAPLLALALGAFGIGATEFGPLGMLPVIADGVGVTIPKAGLLVSAYAIGVLLGAPVMTLVLARRTKRTALITLMAIFTLGNALAALAPGYWSLAGARVVTSLAHGAFFGLGAIVAASLAPPGRAAEGVAGMFMGLAVANIGGVSAAAWLGAHLGWRCVFAAIALLGALTVAALAFALPAGGTGPRLRLRRELAALGRRDVILALATTTVGSAAMFAVYTYIAPILSGLSCGAADRLPATLALIGVGFTVGNVLGGRLPDRWLDRGLVAFLATIAVTSSLLPSLGSTPAGAATILFLWATATFAIVPPLQSRVMGAATDAPSLASAVNIGAFNLGNALGAAAGAAVIARGLGAAYVPYVAASLAAACALLVLLGGAARRR